MTNTAKKDILSAAPNPYRNKVYIVSITQEISLNQQSYLFGLRYVPDKLLLNDAGLANYLEQTLGHKAKSAEILTHEILEDITDQIIPKWIEVNLRQKDNDHGQNIFITMEDRQPGWENTPLLNRLPAIF